MRSISELDAGAFAFVMATGIVSVAASVEHLPVFSDVLLGLACAGWVALALALLPGRFGRPRLQAFALVAATSVVGARLAIAEVDVMPLVLWSCALLFWVVLLARRPSLDELGAGSLLLVVAIESLGALAALVAFRRGPGFVVVGVAAWALGLAVYPLVLAAVARGRPRFEPELWIVMGALAIATLAGTELLLAARRLDTLGGLRQALPDIDLATWALASALVLPVLAGELRVRRWRYEASRWSFVFPLGMYATASGVLGHAEQMPFLTDIGGVAFGVAVAAWALTLLGLARRALPQLRPSASSSRR
jgi:tellurite resistance protein TehA-like permease